MIRTWTKERVIEAIRAEYRDGDPLRYEIRAGRMLGYQARKFFGTWEMAMAAAGLKSLRRRWSKQRVLDEIRAHVAHRLWNRGVWSKHPQLQEAAVRHFGSTQAALRAAGFPVAQRKPMRRWTRQTVLQAIRARHRQGLSIGSTRREDRALYTAARRMYGTWYKALAAAGIPPTQRRWSKQRVLAAIRQRHQRGLPLEATWRDDGPLHGAGKRHFGSWRAAVRAAGLDVRFPRQWTDEAILAAVRNWLAQGRTVTRLWREDKGLYYAAVRRWGSWSAVMAAAGLKSKPRRKWSEDRVIKELQAWRRRCGNNLRLDDHALAGAATRLFGNLEQAFEAAGIEPVHRKWSQCRVIEAVQDQYVAGLPMSKPLDAALSSAVRRHIGRWQDALVAAGVVCRGVVNG